jgi:molecular chaperone HscB
MCLATGEGYRIGRVAANAGAATRVVYTGPVGADPFQTLGLPPAFQVDAAAVERAYLTASATVHPDLAAGDPDAPGRMAEINEARRVLENPELRADALLARLGGPSREQERGLPEGFLAEMMEIRERIDAALSGGSPPERAAWEAWAMDRREEAVREAGALFAGLSSPPKPEELRAVRVRLNAWRYIERLIEQLDPDYESPDRRGVVG